MSDGGEWATVKKGKGRNENRSSGNVPEVRGLASFQRPGQRGAGGRGGSVQIPANAAPGVGLATWASRAGSGTSHTSGGNHAGGGSGRRGSVDGGSGRGGGGSVGGGPSRGDYVQSGGPRQTGYQGRGGHVPSRGRATEFRSLRLQYSQVEVSLENKSFGRWKKFSEDIHDISIPPRPEKPADIGRKQNIVFVNYFETAVNLPPKIRHYQVYISSRNNLESAREDSSSVADVSLRTQVAEGSNNNNGNARFTVDVRLAIANWLTTELERQFKKETKAKVGIAGVITDFVDAMYAAEEIEKYCKLEHDIPGKDLGEEADSTLSYHVSIHPTAEIIDTRDISKIINNLKGKPVPQGVVDLERIYNILVRCYDTRKFTPIGRTSLVLFEKDGGKQLGKGLVSYNGYSVNQTIGSGWKPYLNVEIANVACVPYTKIINYFSKVITRNGFIAEDVTTWTHADRSEINRRSKGIKVSYCRGLGDSGEPMVINAKIAENGVLENSVSKESFMYGTSGKQEKTTIKQYAEKTYTDRGGKKIQLKYPNGPCLRFGGGRLRIVPAEICTIVKGQSFNSRLDEMQTSEMISTARLDPTKLQGKIMQVKSDLSLDNNPLAKKYGVSVKSEMLRLQPRVLPAPEVIYGKQVINGKQVTGDKHAVAKPQNGVWDAWKGEDFGFYKPIEVKKWAILDVAEINPRKLEHLKQRLVYKAGSKGVSLPRNSGFLVEEKLKNLIENHNKNQREKNMKAIESSLTKFHAGECSFVLVIIPTKNGPLYAQVKQVAELKVGIVTQCLAVNNISEANKFESVIGNLILKLHAKLNGINHIIQAPAEYHKEFSLFQREAVMVLGADVTHPSPGGTNVKLPSIAAVTASKGRDGMRFMTSIDAQEKAGKNAAEIIVNFQRIVRDFIEVYISKTGTAPTKIIYYRDGVGSGQFKEILNHEMAAIRAACTSIQCQLKGGNKYEPPITIITVQKRNKTRVFSQDGHRLQNAAAGTVIDEEITHPYENDFFIIPHQGVLGTSRPTRFHVLWDDSDFSNNELQLMTYYLCYMYIRCTRAVRIPAPTYYAHWAAARAKILCEGADSKLFRDLRELNKWLKRPDEFTDLYPMHFV